MTIVNGGNVGVGTSSPSTKLEVEGSGANAFSGSSTSGILVDWADSLTSTNYVGLRIRSPYASGTNMDGVLRMSRGSSSTFIGMELATFTNHPIRFMTNATTENGQERMRIDTVGNVGIGLTDPDTKLEIAGTLKIADGGETCTIADEAGMIRYNTGNLEYCNGSAWQTLGVSGSGLTNFNGETGGTQTLATGATGTAPTFVSGTNTHTLNIPLASGAGVTSGTISKTDYDSFAGKQAAITTGATTQYLRGDLSLSTFGSDVLSSVMTGFTSGAGTVAATDTVLQAIQKLDGNVAAISVPSNTDGLTEGSTNLYFTDTRARTAAVLNVTTGTETDQAPSVAAMKAYVTANGGTGDILNGGNTTGATVMIGTNDAQSLSLETNNSTAMTILAGGNVGIGVLAPSASLDIEGTNINGSSLVLRSGDLSNHTDSTQIRFSYNNTTDYTHSIRTRHNSTSTDGNAIDFWVWDHSTDAPGDLGSLRVMTIDGTGFAGLMDTTPDAHLEISADGETTGSLLMLSSNDANDGDIMTVRESGNIGIGTTTPGAPLDLAGNYRLYTFERAIPTTVDDAIDIGSFTTTNGAIYLSVSVVVDNNNNSMAKKYNIPVAYNETLGAWVTVPPIVDTGFFNTDNFHLDLNITNNVASLRIRNALGTRAGVARISIQATNNSTASFSESSAVASVIAPTDLYGNSLLTQVNGNVGVGTLTPTTELEVNGTVTATAFVGDGSGITGISATGVAAGAGTVGAPSMSFGADTNTGFYSSGADQIGVSTNGVNTFNFTTTALSSPTTGGASITSGNGTAAAPTYSFAGDTDTGWYRPTNNALAAATGGLERIRIDGNGIVEIGTANPGSRLMIAGAQQVSAGTLTNSQGAWTVWNSTPVTGFAGSGMTSFVNHRGSGPGGFTFSNTNDGTALSEFMRIDGSGNVGIGTDTPGEKLEVNGAIEIGGDETPDNTRVNFAASDNSNRFQIETDLDVNQSLDSLGFRSVNVDNLLVLRGDGKVGIGTRTPAETNNAGNVTTHNSKLNVTGVTMSNSFKTNEAGSFGAAIDHDVLTTARNANARNTGVPVGWVIKEESPASAASAVDLNFYPAYSTSRTTDNSLMDVLTSEPTLSLNGNGNVAIGNADPTFKFSISGSSVASAASQTSINSFSGGGVNISGNIGNNAQDAITYQSGGGGGAALSFGRGGSYDTFMAFYTNSSTTATAGAISERMRIDQDGNVGIGTTAPTSDLDIRKDNESVRINAKSFGVNGTTNTPSLLLSSARGTMASPAALQSGDWLGGLLFSANYDGSNSNFGGYINLVAGEDWSASNNGTYMQFVTVKNGEAALTESMRIHSNGNVGVGTVNPGAKLNIYQTNNIDPSLSSTNLGHFTIASSANLLSFGNASTIPYAGWIQSHSLTSTALPFVLNPSGGNVGIGTTNPSYNLHVVGSAGKTTGTAWTSISDRRLKDIKGDYEYGLDAIMKLNTVRFNYSESNELGLPSDNEIVGFIAQEVQKVIPDAVTEREDGFLELNVDPIHWALVNATQEQQAIIEKNISMMKVMENGIESNTRRIASLEEENIKLKEELSMMKEFLCHKEPTAPFCQ